LEVTLRCACPNRSLAKLRAIARGLFYLLALSLMLADSAHAQSQSQPPPPVEGQSGQAPTSSGEKPDASTKSLTDKDNPTPVKVYRNHDIKDLQPGGVSVVGSAPPPQTVGKKVPTPTKEDKDAEAAAYWKARFAATRNKLAADQKALPALQAQLNQERVEEWSVNKCTQQVNSDTFISLQNQIDATKLAIAQDKQALKDLHEEFRRAGGLPGWIR
jgi:hypothetical protein